MANIAKHNTEQEWECNDIETCRVDFLVARYTIGYDYFMERPNELVDFEECRRFELHVW